MEVASPRYKVVVYQGAVREKPSSEAEARQFINGYSGSHAATVTAVLVTNLTTGSRKGEWDRVEIKEGTVLKSCWRVEVAGKTDSVIGLSKEVMQRLIKEIL